MTLIAAPRSFDLRGWKGFAAAGGDASASAPVDEVSVDSRCISGDFTLFVALEGHHCDGHAFVIDALKCGARYALVRQSYFPPERGIENALLRVDSPLRALQEIAQARRQLFRGELVAICGIRGKSLLKELLSQLLPMERCFVSPESYNSQLGVALSLMMLPLDADIALIEAAATKPREIETLEAMLRPTHLIIAQLDEKRGNALDPHLYEIAKMGCHIDRGWVLAPQALSDRFDHCQFYPSDSLINAHLQSKAPIPTLALPGSHRLVALAARAAALLGVDERSVDENLGKLRAEGHHREVLQTRNGMCVINAGGSESVQSVIGDLRLLASGGSPSRRFFLYGGMKRCGNETSPPHCTRAIADEISKLQIDRVYDWSDEGLGVTTSIRVSDAKEALEQLQPLLSPGDRVLIKPCQRVPLETVVAHFEGRPHSAVLTIDLGAIAANVEAIRRSIPKGIRVMAIVKALGYGTNEVQLADFLARCGIDILGVSYVEEGIRLRTSGWKGGIFCLHASPVEAAAVVMHGIEVAVGEAELCHALQAAAERSGMVAKIHLHVDTGMVRFGSPPEGILDLVREIDRCPNLAIEGIMSHLSSADDPQQAEWTSRQIQLFNDVCEKLSAIDRLPKWRHIANSSYILSGREIVGTMVRVGISLYGLRRSYSHSTFCIGLPALSLSAPIVALHRLPPYGYVGYGRSYQAGEEGALIAILPIGYADGLRRHFREGGAFLVRGVKAPIAGNICMDYVMIDVSGIPDLQIGEQALLFGRDAMGHYIAPEEVALRGGTIVHELLAGLGSRIQRVFISGEEKHLHSLS